MERMKLWMRPVLLVAVWATVLWFTLSMAASFGPSLQTVLQQS